MTAPLAEFRCPVCHKLLFKGTLLMSTVEIKCDRCGKIRTIRNLNNDLFDEDSFGLLIGRDGVIVNACVNAAEHLGRDIAELVGMRADEISPAFTGDFLATMAEEARAGLPEKHQHAQISCTPKSEDAREYHAIYMPLVTSGLPYLFVIFTKLDRKPMDMAGPGLPRLEALEAGKVSELAQDALKALGTQLVFLATAGALIAEPLLGMLS